MILEKIDGGDMVDYLNANRLIEQNVLMDKMKVVLRAIAYMNEKGVAHRDIKLENIMAGPPKVIDFSLAIRFQHDEPRRNRIHGYAGTFPYIAPEVMRGNGYGENVDVYSWAIATRIALTG